jgi:hypothetical protein
MSVILLHPAYALAPLFIDLQRSDQMSVILVDTTSALAELLIDLAHSDQMSVISNILLTPLRSNL